MRIQQSHEVKEEMQNTMNDLAASRENMLEMSQALQQMTKVFFFLLLLSLIRSNKV
jgi:type II secretory pathway component PulF